MSQAPSGSAVQPAQQHVSGLVERVTFHGEETGFAVLRVKVKGHRELITVIGTLASVNAGEWLNARGVWVHNKDHGLQLKADFIKCSPPTSREGMEKYLASGMIKGIGPVYARKLVAKFGEKIFDVIEHESARLEEVDGIGPGRRRRIKAAWIEQKAVREIMVFLHTHGVSTSRAVRIYKTYGDAAIEMVRENPYRLAKDIHGIGFRTADTVAEKLGIPKESILRARAGLVHALLEATEDGHCALPQETLAGNAGHLLGVGDAIVNDALAEMLAEGEIVRDQIGGQGLIYLPALKRAEEGIVNFLRRQVARPPGYPKIDLSKALDWVQQKTGKELAPSQQDALAKALHSRVLVITGGPGVGKTTLVHSILLVLRAKKVRCVLCAPTGRAAKRLSEATGVEARTIHRLLGFGPGDGGFSRNAERPLECDLLIADEASMIDVPLLHRLLQAVPPEAHLVLVGDVDQLPSVGPGSALADIIGSGTVPVVRLTEIFRQAAASRIIVNAHRINAGQMPEPEEAGDAADRGRGESDFFVIERDEPDAIQATLLELVSRRIPRKLGVDPITGIQVLCPMNRGSLGAREMNLRLQEKLNPLREEEAVVDRFGWQFRLRDKVIQTENDYDKDVFNGDIGQVSNIDPEEQTLSVRFEGGGREVSYDFGELDELALAYAITVHKSQGSEFPAIVVPVSVQHYLLLQRNLLYTAVTRGKSLVVLVGQRKALAIAVRNQPSGKRFTALLERLRGENMGAAKVYE
ncbi:MAG: ATP-dependent RecD-like DNA helicase [Verrucomicrobia bacterium]|nr:ATP-dependent RecD-like DNA helicase [Verrucomicrobiota bacterium]